MTEESTTNSKKVLSGTAIVLGMFLFGAVLTGGLWTYWYYHTAPFHPLAVAIGREFPHSVPRVDGGQRRMHIENSPRLLWIIMRVPFLPDEDPKRSQATVDRVVDLATQKLDLKSYDQLTVRIFFGEPEKVLHRQDFGCEITNGVPGPISPIEDKDSASPAG